jgi:CheY-like chemotaxis protein
LLSVQTGLREFTTVEIRDTLPDAEIEPGTYAYVSVRDTGCGMDEETKARIFDPFFTTKFTGRGLGLAAVGGIMRGHKGAIHVSSAPGRGSTFIVYLPATAEKLWPAIDGTRHAIVSKRNAFGTVLVVDDEPLVLRTATIALERLGCKVLTADSGAAAIELLQRHAAEVALIILDLSMPVMSGLETLPELRKVRPDVPVLISSGYSESETIRLFSGQTISGFLQKPYTVQHLLERVALAAASAVADSASGA